MKRRHQSSCRAALGFIIALLWGLGMPPSGRAQEARPPVDRDASGWQEIERRPGEGERCLVCGLRAQGDEVVEIRYKGRTFHVKAMMLKEFAQSPDTYFRQLQARGALFDERAMEQKTYSPIWLWLGGYVLIGLLSAAVCGAVAVGRGQAPIPWFFAGLAGNLAALFLLLVVVKRAVGVPTSPGLTKVPTTHAPVACTQCAVGNHPTAAVCVACGTRLHPAYEAEASRA
jgi:hypothetical protein